MTNKWQNNQLRGGRAPYRFAPKWTPETIKKIIDRLNAMVPFAEIELELMQEYSIRARTADYWIEIARRVMVDMSNGLTLEDSLERDRERRNVLRRKKKTE